MKKKLFAAITAVSILCSLCACGAQESPADNETTAGITTEPTEAPAYPVLLSYEAYMKMTPVQQQAYYETFPDPQTYMQWFNNAALAYRENHEEQSGNKAEGNVGVITQPTDPEATDAPTAPTQKPEAPTEKPETPTQKPETPTQKPENPTTKPAAPTQKPTAGSQEEKDPVLLTYAEYLKLTPAQQQAYYESFPSNDAYMQWFTAATKAHNQEQTEGEQTEQPTNPESETTAPNNVGIGGLEGFGGAGSGRPENP